MVVWMARWRRGAVHVWSGTSASIQPMLRLACCEPLHTELLAVTGRMGESQQHWQQAPGGALMLAYMRAPWGVPTAASLIHHAWAARMHACVSHPPCRGCSLTLFLACAALACATTKLLTIFLLPSFESTLDIKKVWACSASCSRF